MFRTLMPAISAASIQAQLVRYHSQDHIRNFIIRSKRTFHVLIQADKSCATDTPLLPRLVCDT